MTITATILPPAFTKGSGKKIAFALMHNGWDITVVTPLSIKATHAVMEDNGSFVPYYEMRGSTVVCYEMRVSVADNGAFVWADMLNSEVGNRYVSMDTVSDTLCGADAPKNFIMAAEAAAVRAADERRREAEKRARDERAALLQKEYADSLGGPTDLYKYGRRAMQRLADEVIDFTLDGRYSPTTVLSQAESIVTTMYVVNYAKRVLLLEGLYNPLTDRCFTFTEAVAKVLLDAALSSDSTGGSSSVHGRAMRAIGVYA